MLLVPRSRARAEDGRGPRSTTTRSPDLVAKEIRSRQEKNPCIRFSFFYNSLRRKKYRRSDGNHFTGERENLEPWNPRLTGSRQGRRSRAPVLRGKVNVARGFRDCQSNLPRGGDSNHGDEEGCQEGREEGREEAGQEGQEVGLQGTSLYFSRISGIRGPNGPPFFLPGRAQLRRLRRSRIPQGIRRVLHPGIERLLYFRRVAPARPSRAPLARSGERMGPEEPHGA